MDCSPPSSSVHRDSPGKNTGVGCHALLQGPASRKGEREEEEGNLLPFKRCDLGTPLVVQWLRICLPVQEMWVSSLVGELRAHGKALVTQQRAGAGA